MRLLALLMFALAVDPEETQVRAFVYQRHPAANAVRRTATSSTAQSAVPPPLYSSTTTTCVPTLQRTIRLEEHDKEQNHKQQTILQFDIDLVHTSEPLALKNNNNNVNELVQAWEQAAVRHGLITPQIHKVQEFVLNATQRQELQDVQAMWRTTTTTTTTEQDIDDALQQSTIAATATTGLRFTTGAVQFPGLTVDSTVTCAVLRRQDKNNNINTEWLTVPYEYHVLETINTASGKRPMVWLYNRLTDGSHAPVSRSVTTVGLVRDNDNDNHHHQKNNICIRHHSRARVTCVVPRNLIRLLPASRQQTERWASQALRQAVTTEIQACLRATRPYLEREQNVVI